MWVRGLKRKAVAEAIGQEKSHPMWVRGLKHLLSYFNKLKNMSHPMWVRGLKLILLRLFTLLALVAPYVGAWIETATALRTLADIRSHPMWVRGLKRQSNQIIG